MTRPSGLSRSARILVGVTAVALVALGIGYTASAVGRSPAGAHAQGHATPATHPGLYIRDGDGAIVVQDRGSSGGTRTGMGLACQRFYAAGGTAVCLKPRTAVTPMSTALILDDRLRVQKEFDFGGVPNRARVSASGRMVSWTVFVTGDDYATTDFSTRTGFYDREDDFLVKSMEDVGLYIDGQLRDPADVNYWGLSFAEDDNTFYVTVSTGGTTYLGKGDLATWTVRTLRTNAECPSLSPDETRIVFKKRVRPGADAPWRLSVLDLSTMKETPLAETRSVDDQAAWVDDQTVSYAVDGGVWEVPASGAGAPRSVAPGASSPSLVR